MHDLVTVKKGHRQFDEPTPRERSAVLSMAGFGISQNDIARAIGCNRETLKRHFTEELELGLIKANANIAKRLYTKAMKGDTSSLIWWTKARMGWHETVVNRHGGEDGGPIKIALSHADNEL